MLAPLLRSGDAHVSVVCATASVAPSSWRERPVTTIFARYGDGKVRMRRERPSPLQIDHFVLTAVQVHALFTVLRFPTSAHQVICLPEHGRGRVEGRVLPDGGMQLYRFDRSGKRVQTFRLASGDWPLLVAACQPSGVIGAR